MKSSRANFRRVDSALLITLLAIAILSNTAFARTSPPSGSLNSTATSTSGSGAAVIVSPAPGSTLSGSNVTFQWSAGSAAAYALTLGSTARTIDIYSSNVVTTTSVTVGNIPTDGRTVYATLYSQVNNTWVSQVYTYAAATKSSTPTPTPSITPTPSPTATPTPTASPTPTGTPKPTPSPTPTPVPTATPTPSPGTVMMVSPAPGSIFAGSTVTLQWTAGSATAYALTLGSSARTIDIYNSGTVHTISVTVSNIPTDGRTVYATLYSQVNNSWVSNLYNYTASKGSATPTPTPSVTPTPTATPTPSPTPTPTPTATATPTSTPTPTPTPSGSPTSADAGRFLTQSTFGPTSSLISQVQQSGYANFLNSQFSTSATLTGPRVDAAIAALPTGTDPSLSTIPGSLVLHRGEGAGSIAAARRLRVERDHGVSANGNDLYGHPEALATYWDLLAPEMRSEISGN